MSGAAKTHCPWLSQRFMSTVICMAGSVVFGCGVRPPSGVVPGAPVPRGARDGCGRVGRGQETGGLKRE
ncbi:hypothetical protein GCM10010280_59990 [Streptomyces pilosus]|uniref:Lipoprotein n=1 Tax=Streptomyces pilosus TaxID=28893 RepID=A0A918C2S2_9ACTN|nr:hypothetical protein GCM10010280_59990 [Streptomyces pilosus]